MCLYSYEYLVNYLQSDIVVKGKMLKSKLIAFATHLASSIFVISFCVYLVYFIWYPYPYYELHDTNDIAPVLAMVDVVLGPIVTFIVYNKMKPVAELTRDISIVVTLQLGALLWGMHAIYGVRPVFNVFINDAFHSVTTEKLELDKIPDGIELPGFFEGPRLVYVKFPFITPEEQSDYLVGVLYKGVKDLRYRTEMYEKVTDHIEEIKSKSLSIDAIENNKGYKQVVTECLGDKSNWNGYLFYPFRREVKGYLITVKPEDIR